MRTAPATRCERAPLPLKMRAYVDDASSLVEEAWPLEGVRRLPCGTARDSNISDKTTKACASIQASGQASSVVVGFGGLPWSSIRGKHLAKTRDCLSKSADYHRQPGRRNPPSLAGFRGFNLAGRATATPANLAAPGSANGCLEWARVFSSCVICPTIFSSSFNGCECHVLFASGCWS